METFITKIGWSGRNYDASVEFGDDIVVATGSNLLDVKKSIKDALNFHFEGLTEEGEDIPKKWRLRFDLQPSAILKSLDGLVSRATISRVTMINERQLGHYIQGKREGKPETKEAILKGIEKIKSELEGLVA